MSNLNKIKEEGVESFNQKFPTMYALVGLNPNEKEDMKPKVLDWHNKQMDKAYKLGQQDERVAVVEEIEEMSTGLTINSYTELVKKTSYLEALDSLKQKLLSLKNKEN